MVMAQNRHGKRPAHIHFLISAPGYRELVTALYIAGDEHLDDDVVFGASGDLVAEVKANDPASPIKGVPSIHFDFSLAREFEADRRAGRVGSDPGAITAGNGKATTPYGAPPPEMLAAEQPKKGGISPACSAASEFISTPPVPSSGLSRGPMAPHTVCSGVARAAWPVRCRSKLKAGSSGQARG